MSINLRINTSAERFQEKIMKKSIKKLVVLGFAMLFLPGCTGLLAGIGTDLAFSALGTVAAFIIGSVFPGTPAA
jgi:hypothetical protein